MREAGDGVLPAAVRRDRVLAALKTSEFLRVSDLGEMFGVSEVTVRADLDALAHRGEVRRVRGGAIPVHDRSVEDTDEAVAVGRAAAAMVSSGESVILDVGTPTVAAALRARPELDEVTVVTNELDAALALEDAAPRITVIVSGGTLVRRSLVDPLAGELLAQINADRAFVGCDGVHPEGGVTGLDLPRAEVKRRMLALAGHRVVVADGAKLGEVAVAHLCEVTEIDLLLTGASAPRPVLDELAARGVDVEVAM